MEAQAKLKNCPMSARKMRLVMDNIRGKSVDEALNLLKFTKKEAALWAEKVLMSAVANWENKTQSAYSVEDHGLYIKRALSDEGMVLKRFRPAPHGRAHRIRKKYNHVTIVVENKVAIEEDNAQEVAEIIEE